MSDNQDRENNTLPKGVDTTESANRLRELIGIFNAVQAYASAGVANSNEENSFFKTPTASTVDTKALTQGTGDLIREGDGLSDALSRRGNGLSLESGNPVGE